MPLSDTIEPGTLIHGTHRECDLIPAFFDALSDYSPAHAERIANEYGPAFIDRCSDPKALDYSLTGEIERRAYLLGDLFDALDDIAPDGFYFGSHVGDGADFGFWEVDA